MKKNSNPRILRGTVKNISGTKTIAVEVLDKKPHQIYDKILSKHKTYLAHINNANEVEIGDWVSIQETAPISKRKTWKVVKVTKQDQ